jgi:hypothetical protein
MATSATTVAVATVTPTLSTLPATNTQVVLAERPTGLPDEKTFRVVHTPTPKAIGDNEVLLQTLYASVDPAMRGWITDKKSYLPPVPIGGVMRAGGIPYFHHSLLLITIPSTVYALRDIWRYVICHVMS